MTTPESSENREIVGSGTAESVAAQQRELTEYEKGYLDGLLKGTRHAKRWPVAYHDDATAFLRERGLEAWKVKGCIVSDAAHRQDSRTPEEWFAHIDQLEAEVTRLRNALEHLASPNYSAKATGKDARDMAEYARRTLNG